MNGASVLSVFRNFLGAFADGAILFPILALLCAKAGYSGGVVLLTTGLIYVISAAVFRVPMAVQPLKSIAIAAVAVGATHAEVRWAGALLGGACLAMVFTGVDRLARRVPAAVVHQLQVGLGVLLVLQGWSVASGLQGELPAGVPWAWGVVALAALMVALPEVRGLPLLGVVASAGFAFAVLTSHRAGISASAGVADFTLRAGMVAGLVLPQIALTSANSVVGTRDVCERYFGAGARRVTARGLLASIGVGNILVAIVGGMPFCHGSGGVTAHARGGASRAWSTALFGGLLILAAIPAFFGAGAAFSYPEPLAAVLLVAIGAFHMRLAAPTAASAWGRSKLAAALALTWATRNLLWVLAAASFFEVLEAYFAARAGRGVEAGA